MTENIHEFIEFKIDSEKKLLYGKWLRDVNNTEYRTGLQLVQHLVDSNNIKLWLQNSENLKPRGLEDQKFATEEFGFMLVNSPLEYIAVVASKQSPHFAVLLSLREKAYRIFGKSKHLELFETEAEALGWLIPNMQYYRLPATTYLINSDLLK